MSFIIHFDSCIDEAQARDHATKQSLVAGALQVLSVFAFNEQLCAVFTRAGRGDRNALHLAAREFQRFYGVTVVENVDRLWADPVIDRWQVNVDLDHVCPVDPEHGIHINPMVVMMARDPFRAFGRPMLRLDFDAAVQRLARPRAEAEHTGFSTVFREDTHKAFAQVAPLVIGGRVDTQFGVAAQDKAAFAAVYKPAVSVDVDDPRKIARSRKKRDRSGVDLGWFAGCFWFGFGHGFGQVACLVDQRFKAANMGIS
ncbi:MAG: hypothetical protein AAFY25_05810 [Pseudomonadota bacterium]